MAQESNIALRATLASHVPSLRNLARHLVADHVADDLVQDTLAAALDQPQPPNHLGAWLTKVLRNRVHRTIRSRHRREAREVRAAVEPEILELEDLVTRRRMVAALTDLLRELDEPYQQTLRLRFFEGW
ncbi:MAG: sigma-70 family RNA polymerase sigma factor, partial [Nannocystaceae bacterium]|nr:sigma-70 family RNA polymerase sigma factor [Nannocystaceae bacterium]